MRIAMFSWESLHSIAVGGVAPHVTELAAALQRRNHEVHVFTRRGEGQQIHEEKNPEKSMKKLLKRQILMENRLE